MTHPLRIPAQQDQLTTNFRRTEFACKGETCCGNTAAINPILVYSLQILRDLIGAPIHVSSGFRCTVHNQAVGGSEHSYHCLGLAADIWTPHSDPPVVARLAHRIDLFRFGGMAVYENFVHLDIGEGPRRWGPWPHEQIWRDVPLQIRAMEELNIDARHPRP